MKNDRRRPARPRPGGPAAKKAQQRSAPRKATPKKATQVARPAREEPRTLRLGLVPGATPGRWIDTWNERMPHVELELVPLSFADQRERLHDVDLALVRLPLRRPGDLHVIPLYDEVPVVVAAKESHLMAADELSADDLAGQVLITPGDDVLGPLDLPTVTPTFPTIETTEDAVATVASGVGILVVPMSLARMHKRKDADYRPLTAGPVSTVALAWPRDATTPDVETFVGIVRGRTANSSR
ncbi:LysR family substrate-binding domain-containing protein [Microbacterium sp. ARD32]|uniref:LysR family substrate-binding domain-containing protein n=1 Tax=Microbacterium sp. ARD32 TaxID=2962577 RepID=UPI0028817F27|nr:LysR family substrate-binding domain-containing protein [Microbacterium sp. ARD32]MDT0158312.1 LysR family substrate-binding domain-containing protein [Microbacterium sp. ARD32]